MVSICLENKVINTYHLFAFPDMFVYIRRTDYGEGELGYGEGDWSYVLTEI